MLPRLLILCFACFVFNNEISAFKVKRDGGTRKINLQVGKPAKLPEIKNEEGKKESKEEPTSDVIPQSDEGDETTDKQDHPGTSKNETREIGMPPRYPLKAMSAEVSAHDNEIGGCRDHPNANRVCQRCGNTCFAEEHETYTYSYCRRSCRHCNPELSAFNTFWRLRAISEFEPTWMLKQVEFYATPDDNVTLVDTDKRAYASSTYSTFYPSYAFDGNRETSWYPSGWGKHDNEDDWIAFEFPVAVRIHAVRMVLDENHRTASPKRIMVEASNKKFGPFVKKWVINNPTYEIDRVYKVLECPVLWRKFENDDGQWCFRQIAKFESWESAKETCEIEGGQLASVLSNEEQRFVTDDIMLCGLTWIGLSHRDNAYFWDDGSNSTNTKCDDGSSSAFKNWKPAVTYSDVQKQSLKCVAMDRNGYWMNFHCSNKFYFLCKKKLLPMEAPREDLVQKAWPYDPEIPPLIFLYPNVTVPVINSKNLEPGVFPDANGNVEEEEEEEESKADLLYEQTVEHLKEKGLRPSEEIENDVNEDETDYMQQLNKIALEATGKDDYRNETAGDELNKNDAKKQAKIIEQQQNNNQDQNITNVALEVSQKEAGAPVVPAPLNDPGGEKDANGENELPRIVNGKPVQTGNGANSNNAANVGKPTTPASVQNGSSANGPLQNPDSADIPSTPPPNTDNAKPTPASAEQASGSAATTNANNNNNKEQNNGNNPSAASNNNNNGSSNPQQSTNQQGNISEGGSNANVSNANNNGSSSNNNNANSNDKNPQNANESNQQQSGSQQNNGQQNNNQQSNNEQQNNNQEQNNQQQSNNNQQNNNQDQNKENQNNQQDNKENSQNNGDNNQNNEDNNDNDDGDQDDGNQESGTAPTPANSEGNWTGNGASLPGPLNAKTPEKVPSPPPNQEGVGDKEPSVGGAGDEEAKEDDEDGDSNQGNNNNQDGDNNQNGDENDSNVATVPKPDHMKSDGKSKEEPTEQDVTVGGTNDNNKQQQQNFAKQSKPSKAMNKLAHKKSKPAVAMRKATHKKLVNKAKKKSKLSKKVEISKKEEDDTANSGSGSEGADDEVDEVLETITNDLW